METRRKEGPKGPHLSSTLLAVLVPFLMPFAVLMVSGLAESYVRASYAISLGVLIAWAGVLIVLRARKESLASRLLPDRIKPAWTLFVRMSGMLVIGGAAYLMASTIPDVTDLLMSKRPRMFIEEARGVQPEYIRPLFQTVRLRGEDHSPALYMFAYGGDQPGERR